MKCNQCGIDLPVDAKFCTSCGSKLESAAANASTPPQHASRSRLRKRSLPGVFFEATRLYYTNLRHYFPAIALPGLILFLIEISLKGQLEKPSAWVFVLVMADVLLVGLLSGVLGHITAHIYVSHDTDKWSILGSASRLVFPGVSAGFIPAFAGTLLLILIPHLGSEGKQGQGIVLLFPVMVLFACSILAPIVVESEGFRNPFKATIRAIQLLSASEHVYWNAFKVLLVLAINMLVVYLLDEFVFVKFLAKFLLEPVFEIVYGLLYFNLRFVEGGFDLNVLKKELGFESSQLEASLETASK